MPLLTIKDLVKTYPRPGASGGQGVSGEGAHRVVDIGEFSLEAAEQLALAAYGAGPGLCDVEA